MRHLRANSNSLNGVTLLTSLPLSRAFLVFTWDTEYKSYRWQKLSSACGSHECYEQSLSLSRTQNTTARGRRTSHLVWLILLALAAYIVTWYICLPELPVAGAVSYKGLSACGTLMPEIPTGGTRYKELGSAYHLLVAHMAASYFCSASL